MHFAFCNAHAVCQGFYLDACAFGKNRETNGIAGHVGDRRIESKLEVLKNSGLPTSRGFFGSGDKWSHDDGAGRRFQMISRRTRSVGRSTSVEAGCALTQPRLPFFLLIILLGKSPIRPAPRATTVDPGRPSLPVSSKKGLGDPACSANGHSGDATHPIPMRFVDAIRLSILSINHALYIVYIDVLR